MCGTFFFLLSKNVRDSIFNNKAVFDSKFGIVLTKTV